ncbi:hypothetical protein [Cellvibrio sp. PSBB023]|uniref:hypothetical protein n=1 Tax=Cellvibrio sp. PSBB023 TaxID=1945512 RepID=UPI0026A21A6B
MKKLASKNSSWFSSGSPWIWLNGGAIALCMIMVIGLLGLIAVRGFGHFWPADILQTSIVDRTGQTHIIMGEAVRDEVIPAAVARDGGYEIADDVELITRHLFKMGNRDISGRDFVWYLDIGMKPWEYPTDAVAIERREWGNFYGYPVAIKEGEQQVSELANADFWMQLDQRLTRALDLHAQVHRIEKVDIGRINKRMDDLRLERRRLELNGVQGAAMAAADAEFAERRAALEAEYAVVKKARDDILAQATRDKLMVRTADGKQAVIGFDHIVRVTRPNVLGVFGKLGQYFDRLWEFLADEPREANTEGGIFPAIFGTITMVIVMSIMVTPLGILAAIYLREYAKQGTLLKIIRISVYNLAGVPSIVYGVFGLGFFVYILGAVSINCFILNRCLLLPLVHRDYFGRRSRWHS